MACQSILVCNASVYTDHTQSKFQHFGIQMQECIHLPFAEKKNNLLFLTEDFETSTIMRVNSWKAIQA